MKLNNLVGISGSINSGKDLVGEMLLYISNSNNPTYKGFQDKEDLIQYEYEIKKCAEKLKEIVAITIGCTRKDLEDEVFKNTPLGEEWERYRLDSTYVPDPLYISSNAVYTDTTYFAELKDAEAELKHMLYCHDEYCYSGIIEKEILTPRKVLQLFGTQGGREQVHPNIWVNSLFSDWKPRDKGLEYTKNIEFNKVNDYFHTSCYHCKESYSGFKRQYLCYDCINDDSYQIYPKWIITDVRFPKNEGVAVTKRGGLLIGIRRKFLLKFPQHINLRIGPGEDEFSIPRDLQNVDIELWKSLTHTSERSMGDHSWCDVILENNGTIEDLFNKLLNAVS